MKKKLILMCVAGVLVMTAIIGGTLAGFNTGTESEAVTNITVKSLGIEMLGTGKEVNTETVYMDEESNPPSPGSEVELTHNIVNNIEEGYTLYTRVTINKKWKDSKLDASNIHLYVGEGENKVELIPNEDGTAKVVNDWIVWYADDEQVVMYYTHPLAADEVSKNFIESVTFGTDMDNKYAGKNADISFEADAVQQFAAEDSIPSEWGVYPTFEDNGDIVSIEE